MDLRQLTTLVAIADHGSFSAAARALYTVQSNVSGHIARLEKELGRHARRPPARRPHRRGRRRSSSGPAECCTSSTTSPPTWPRAATTSRGDSRVRRASAPPPGGCCRSCSAAIERAHPGRARHRARGQHHRARPAGRGRAPRRRDRAPAGRRHRGHRRAAVRRGPAAPAAHTQPPARRCTTPSAWRRSPHEPLLLPPTGTALRRIIDRAAAAVDVELTRAGRDRRRPPAHLAGLRGLRRGDRAGHGDPPLAEGRLHARSRCPSCPAASSAGCSASARRRARRPRRCAACSARSSTSRAPSSPASTSAPTRSPSPPPHPDPPDPRRRAAASRCATRRPPLSVRGEQPVMSRGCRPSRSGSGCRGRSAPTSASSTAGSSCGSTSTRASAAGRCRRCRRRRSRPRRGRRSDKRLPLVAVMRSSGADIAEGFAALHGWGLRRTRARRLLGRRARS